MQSIRDKKNKSKGFTLIELLIVVAIISLLASIVAAVLTEARVGARNNRKNELARQYVNVLEFYFSEKGIFPEGGCTSCETATRVCLGEGYPNGLCNIYGTHNENTIVNSQLSEFAPSMPPLLDKAGEYFGAAYGCIDNTCKGYKLTWVLEGGGNDGECAGGATQVPFGNTLSYCTWTSNTASN